MSHLPERCLSSQPQPQPPMSNNKSFRFSRTFQKLLRFVFKSRNKLRISSTRSTSNNISTFQVAEKYSNDRFYVVYDKSEPVLSTIPELPEFEVGVLSPDITSFVRKSASERFMATASIGISSTIDSQSIASQLFAFSLFPYIGFLYFITKSKTAPNLTLFGFYFLLAFVGATNWLHGGAESLLTLTNLFIVLGLREGLRKAENSQRDQNASTPNSGLDE
ncbi:hypothetical protein JHK85_013999 [Glycine max]|nr:hypothetical protein JHK85_013999 [Glycine max]